MHRRSFLQSIVVATAAVGFPDVATASPRATREVRSGSVRMLVTEPQQVSGSAVVLLPTIAGIDSYMAHVAELLARDGHVVATWDPYDGKAVPATTPGRLALSRGIRDDDAIHGIRTVIDHLTGPMKLKRIATIGWCLGGRYALLHGGLDQRVAAVVSYNPTIYSPTPVIVQGHLLSKADFPGQTLDEFGISQRIACPVQIARPGHDLAQPAEYDRLQKALYARSVSTRIDYFPAASHGFAYQPKSEADRTAAAIAWAGSRALFDTTLSRRPLD